MKNREEKEITKLKRHSIEDTYDYIEVYSLDEIGDKLNEIIDYLNSKNQNEGEE